MNSEMQKPTIRSWGAPACLTTLPRPWAAALDFAKVRYNGFCDAFPYFRSELVPRCSGTSSALCRLPTPVPAEI